MWTFFIGEEQIQSKRRKRGRVREESLEAKRTKEYFICMVSIDISTHSPSFIMRAGYHASLGFPGRSQPLLHTLEQANSVCPLWGREERKKQYIENLFPEIMLLTTPLLSMDEKGSSKLYRKFQNLNDHVPYKTCDAWRNKLI